MGSMKLAKLLGGYTLLGFLPLGVSFLLVPLYTSRLSPSEYGVLAEANITLTFTQLAVQLGLDAAFARFYFDCSRDSDERYTLLGAVVGAILALTGLIGVALALVGPML